VKYLAKEKQGIDNMQADHPMWSKTFAATANALRTSESAQILLKMHDAIGPATPQVVVDQILNNPVIKEEYRRLRGPGTVQERAQWLTTLRNSVESMTATPEARKLLMSAS